MAGHLKIGPVSSPPQSGLHCLETVELNLKNNIVE